MLKMMQNDIDIIQKLRNYQFNLYKGDTVKLKDIRFECHTCKVHFTPSDQRVKELMDKRGVVNECKSCEKESGEV